MVLNYIEKKTKKPISSLFDIITGTSTGALLGVVLNIPNEKGSKVPKYNTDDALNLYMKECPALFQTNLMINLKNLWGLRSARYSSTSKRDLINRYCQDLRINDCLSDIIIPAFDIREGKPYFFKSKNAEYHDKYNYKLADVLDATSAAPTYFKPCKVSNQDESEERGYRLFVDGALTANCPALCALIDSIKMYGRVPNDIFILSLGCGDADIGVDDTTASNWGALNWAPYFPSALINGSMDTVSYQIDDLLNDPNYYRFQVRIPSKNANIDDASAKNLAWLKDCGMKFVNDNTSKLDEVCNILLNGFK
ncbi:FabD/lysophospholipase-like protein [Neoconidiobolus thromboides FSU 785]|nr:FabD/lysophospholipase-like protein [Neoconidiobolus thromboides FSU 785]